MAEKKAKTAEKTGDAGRKHQCPSCGTESRVVYFTGFGQRGFFWVCDKNCGYTERTR
jgi:ribosomal protein L37AE/L43A